MHHLQRSVSTVLVGVVVVAGTLLGSTVAPRDQATAAVARSARIVLFRSIGPVSLGDSPQRVQRRLGAPTHVIRLLGRVVQMQYWRFGLNVHFNTQRPGDPANFVVTAAPRFQTMRGIHPGSTITALTHAYSHLRRSGATYSLFGKRGRSRTDFNAAHHRIQTIDIEA